MDASTLKNNHSMNTMHAMFKILIGTLFEKIDWFLGISRTWVNSQNSNEKRCANRDSKSAKLDSKTSVLVLPFFFV